MIKMVTGSITDEEVKEHLNFIEELMSHASANDEYLAAILNNQRLMVQALSGETTPVNGESSGIPSGTAGLATEGISQGDVGEILFKVDGRTVLSDFRAGTEINPDEVVRVAETDGEVYPASDVPPSKLDFGEISFSSSKATKFVFEETDDDVTINPGETKTVVSVQVNEPVGWYETGTNDTTFSEYQYVVDGEDMLQEPLKKPLGLYNDMYRFPEPILVSNSLEIRVTRQSDASGPHDYFSNVTLM